MSLNNAILPNSGLSKKLFTWTGTGLTGATAQLVLKRSSTTETVTLVNTENTDTKQVFQATITTTHKNSLLGTASLGQEKDCTYYATISPGGSNPTTGNDNTPYTGVFKVKNVVG